MNKITRAGSDEEILTPRLVRANQFMSEECREAAVVLGVLEFNRIPLEDLRGSVECVTRQCPECGSDVSVYAEKCACGLRTEDM